MAGSAVEVLKQFGDVEDGQQYTRLVDLFADDAVYYDPLFGAQRGKDAIRGFLEHMEQIVPGSGVRFDSWHVEADTECGWAQWLMVAPDASGEEVPVPGQSLYRLRDGKVTFVADYLDCRAYRTLRGPDGKVPDHASSIGMSRSDGDPSGGAALDTIKTFWQTQADAEYRALADLFAGDARLVDPIDGEFVGQHAIAEFFAKMETEMPELGATFDLVDAAGDDSVGWTQWHCRFPNGVIPGWTLHTFLDGKITLAHDVFDTNVARSLRS